MLGRVTKARSGYRRLKPSLAHFYILGKDAGGGCQDS